MARFFHYPIPAAVWLATAALAVGAENEAKKPAEDNSITTSRKELEALRTEHILGPTEEKLSLSTGLEASALSGAGGSPTPSPKPESPDATPTPAKSAGWLIDGMEKARESDKYGRTEMHDAKNAAELRIDPKGRTDQGDEAAKAAGREPDNFRDVKQGVKASNPLTGYMATWMTPGDFVLLQKPAVINGGGVQSAGLEFKASAGNNLTGGSEATPGAGGFATGSNSSVVAENPYLQGLAGNPLPANGAGFMASPPSPKGLESPGWLQPQSVGPAFLSPVLPQPSRATQMTPDILKPSEDAKYFPQLKRF